MDKEQNRFINGHPFTKTEIMSKQKEGKAKSDKTAPTKNLKEKRVAKAAKKKDKGKEE